jgi:hypothetical protein
MSRELRPSVIQAPTGVFIFVGSVPTILAEAVPATRADVMGGRAFRNVDDRVMTWKFPNFPTKAEAIAFAAGRGVTVQGEAA